MRERLRLIGRVVVQWREWSEIDAYPAWRRVRLAAKAMLALLIGRRRDLWAHPDAVEIVRFDWFHIGQSQEWTADAWGWRVLSIAWGRRLAWDVKNDSSV